MADEEEELRQRIKALFAKVRAEHREQVIAALQTMRNNDQRLGYLKGWINVDVSAGP